MGKATLPKLFMLLLSYIILRAIPCFDLNILVANIYPYTKLTKEPTLSNS